MDLRFAMLMALYAAAHTSQGHQVPTPSDFMLDFLSEPPPHEASRAWTEDDQDAMMESALAMGGVMVSPDISEEDAEAMLFGGALPTDAPLHPPADMYGDEG